MQRGDIWWADLGDQSGSTPGYRRPVLIVQADSFTRSRINTVIVVVLTRNLRLAAAPGNLLLTAAESRLPADSVINASQVITLDKGDLDSLIGRVTASTLDKVDRGSGSC